MKYYAVILAGGTGSRMSADLPKQFLPLNGKPVLYHSILPFLDAFPDIQLIIVLHPDFNDLGRDISKQFFPGHQFQFVHGGLTRFHSVQNGLSLIDGTQESIIMVHDAARCMVTADLIRRCAAHAATEGSAIPVIHCNDSIRWIDDSGNKPLDRTKIRIVQTPQVFQSSVLLPAFKTEFMEKFTDEATVVENSGKSVALVEGDEKNFKVTRPLDLTLAEFLLHQVGQG